MSVEDENEGDKGQIPGAHAQGEGAGRGFSLGNSQKEERARKGQSPVSTRQREGFR